MRHVNALLLILAVTLAAQAAELNGMWDVDVEKNVEELQNSDNYKQATPEKKQALDQFIQGIRNLSGKLSYSFSDAEMKILIDQGANLAMTVVKKEVQADGSVVLVTKQGDIQTTYTITFVDDDHAMMQKQGEDKVHHLIRK